MEAIKNQFLHELTELKNLITFYHSESKLLDEFDFNAENPNDEVLRELSNNLKGFYISKRQFNYNSIIISLYGSFERFIENILVSYLDTMHGFIDKYDKLPEAIVKNHFTLSILLLNKIEQPKYSGSLTKQIVVKNLHTCLNINEDYQLNKDAFAQHSANFRLQVIDEIFSHIGIAKLSSLILKDGHFYNYTILQAEKSIGDKINFEEAFYHLNDLAERRNDVAHGVPSEILQDNILLDYIEFFEIYTKALYNVLVAQQLHVEINYSGKKLGEVTDVYREGKVICILNNKVSIRVGDTLIGKNKTTIIKARILNIQLNGKKVDMVDDKDNYELGIELDNNFRKNLRVYTINNH